MKLKVYRVEKKRFINSLQLHQALGLNAANYWRWIRAIIENQSLEDGVDFKEHYEKLNGHGRKPNQYLLTIVVAKAVCINTGTILAKRVNSLIR